MSPSPFDEMREKKKITRQAKTNTSRYDKRIQKERGKRTLCELGSPKYTERESHTPTYRTGKKKEGYRLFFGNQGGREKKSPSNYQLQLRTREKASDTVSEEREVANFAPREEEKQREEVSPSLSPSRQLSRKTTKKAGGKASPSAKKKKKAASHTFPLPKTKGKREKKTSAYIAQNNAVTPKKTSKKAIAIICVTKGKGYV